VAKDLVIVMARAALVAWCFVTIAIAAGSLLATPWPFVLVAFAVAANPPLATSHRVPLAPLIVLAVSTALVPVWLLASYGEAEGGVSGAADILKLTVTLFAAALGLAFAGYGIGRLTWRPTHRNLEADR
jgi:hypothetical protein